MTTPQQQALADFQAAREHYLARRFAEARAAMQRYRQTIDYKKFKQQDNRAETNTEISVIIVGYATGPELLDCIQSVLTQQGPRFEIILVDNGQNEAIHPQLAQLPICWISPPINLLPSEGRNLGAHFACSDVLVFLDDDALMAPGYLAAVQQRAQGNEHLALRGRIQPKTPTTTPAPKHYDLGETEKPTEFNLEGNMVIRRSLFQKLGGFDPLMFGHEGKALTQQWHLRFPGSDIRYCPDLIIHHDWAEADNLANKRTRQALGKDYLDYLKEHVLNAGITILIRADDKLAATDDFLASLIKHNTYKPVEVIILAKEGKQALAIARKYIAKIFVLILPGGSLSLSGFSARARYENILIIEKAEEINNNTLRDWVRGKINDPKRALLCSKYKLSKIDNCAIDTSLLELSDKLNLCGAERGSVIKQPQNNMTLSCMAYEKKQSKLKLKKETSSRMEQFQGKHVKNAAMSQAKNSVNCRDDTEAWLLDLLNERLTNVDQGSASKSKRHSIPHLNKSKSWISFLDDRECEVLEDRKLYVFK